MRSTDRKKIFISYAHGDGQGWAGKISDFLSRIDEESWQDIHDMIGDHDNLTEVKKAIDKAEHLVIVVTRNALQSEWVNKEWLYALENGINVCPIIVDTDCIRKLTGWQKNRQRYEFDKKSDLNRLIKVVKGSGVRDKLCRYIPEMPVKYIRRDIVDDIKNRLIDKDGKAIKTNVALVGAGGNGKTVVAKAVCMDEDINVVYSGGIIPVVIGNDVSFSSKSFYESHILGIVKDVIFSIKGYKPKFSSLESALNNLAMILDSVDNVLLFIDDVWRESDLRFFLRVSGKCSKIITTRNRGCIEGDIEKYDVGGFDEDDSFNLLSYDLPGATGYEEQKALKYLSKKLCGWAQLIAMANRWVLKKCEKGNDTKDAVMAFGKLLDEKGYVYFDPRIESDRDRALVACIDASIEVLSENEKKRFFEMSIFPENQEIPFDIIFMLWKKTGNMDEDESAELCEYLYDSSLLESFSVQKKAVKIHNNFLRYLKNKCSDEKRAEINGEFIDAILEKYPSGYSSVSVDDRYVWRNMVWHLGECRRYGAINNILTEYTWIKGKITSTNCVELYASYFLWDTNELIERIGQAIGLSLVSIAENIESLPDQLWGRLGYYKDNDEFLNDLKKDFYKSHLYFLYPSLTPPGLQKMKLIGYKEDESVVSVNCLDDDEFVVGCSDFDKEIIWKTDTGELIDAFDLRDSSEQSIYYSNDYVFCAIYNGDSLIRVISTQDRKIVADISISSNEVNTCYFSKDRKRLLVIADDDEILIYNILDDRILGKYKASSRVLDASFSSDGNSYLVLLENGVLIYFRDHKFNVRRQIGPFDDKIYKFLFLSDDARVLGVFESNTLFVWDINSSDEYTLLESCELAYINDLAFSKKLSKVIAADINGKICIWSLKNFLLIKCYEDHEYAVKKIKVSSSDNMLLTASLDNTARLYNLKDDNVFQVYKGHEGGINDACFTGDQKYVITGSSDSTVRMWYVKQVTIPHRFMNFHEKKVNHVLLSPSLDLMISSSDDKEVKIWDINTGNLFCQSYEAKYPVFKSIFSDDGKFAAALLVDGSIDVFAVKSKPECLFKKYLTIGNQEVSISCAQFTPDSKYIAVAGADYIVRLFDVNKKDVISLYEGHEDIVNSIAFTSDGKRTLTSSNDGLCGIWNNENNFDPVVIQGHNDKINSAFFSADDKYVLTASNDGMAKIWDSNNGEEYKVFDCTKGIKKERLVKVIKAEYLEENDYVFTCSEEFIEPAEYYWSAKVWSVKSEKVIMAFENRMGRAPMVHVSSDGKYILFVNGKFIRLYDLQKNVEVDSLTFDADVTAFACNGINIGLGDKLGGIHMCRFQR